MALGTARKGPFELGGVVFFFEAGAHGHQAVAEALRVLMAGRTVLAVAHRIATVAAATRILVLEEGRVVEVIRRDARAQFSLPRPVFRPPRARKHSRSRGACLLGGESGHLHTTSAHARRGRCVIERPGQHKRCHCRIDGTTQPCAGASSHCTIYLGWLVAPPCVSGSLCVSRI